MTLFLSNEGDAGGDEAFPSTFELAMQDRMSKGFKPAFQYVMNAVCDVYPHLGSSAPVIYFHETYALLQLLVERYCLSHYDSLLSERFYGIKRLEYTAKKPLVSLSEKSRHLSLWWHVGVPYIKAKLDAYHENLLVQRSSSSEDDDDGINTIQSTLSPALMTRFWRHWKHLRLWHVLQRLFVDMYPTVHCAYEGVFLLFQWMYLFGHTLHFSPFLRAMKVVLARTTPTDIVRYLYIYALPVVTHFETFICN
jgi:peroxin-12